jgi:putative thioredoxin
MSESPYMYEVDEAGFDELVLNRSHNVPVLVDFWAAWCGPCQVLMPRLAKLAEEYQGRFILAKVNTDVEQRLAGRYGIRSLPTVKLFRNGEVVDEFMGAQPDSTIRDLLDRHLPRESDSAAEAALRDHQAGRTEDALQALRAAVALDPANDRVKLQLARLLFDLGRLDEGDQILRSVSVKALGDPETTALAAKLEFARVAAGAPPAPELEQAIGANPGNMQARYQLAARRVLEANYEAAMEQLVEIVRSDRRFADDAGRKGLLTVFNLLGGKGDLVKRYRNLLSMAMH